MQEQNIIKEMPQNPYLLAYFKNKRLEIGDKWIAADYIIWIDEMHNKFRQQHNLPTHIVLNETEEIRFIEFIN